MRRKLLFVTIMMLAGILQAQVPNNTLVISEARYESYFNFIEITNMGATAVNLKDYEVGSVGPWTGRIDPADITKWFNTTNYFMLPDKMLAPGKSFVIAKVFDWNQKIWQVDRTKGNRVMGREEYNQVADMIFHVREAPYQPNPMDSVTPGWEVLELWNGRDCLYLRHHFAPGDSAVIDQVGGVFDGPDGQNKDQAYNVAGYKNATNLTTLVRKFNVKTGNLDFATARGVDITDSEWMPIPHLYTNWGEHQRKLFWTVGNHGDYNLNSSTLVSSKVDINWTDSTITVPWGTRKDDSVMMMMDKKPGLAWHYHYSPRHSDSAYWSVREGDVLTVYACGNDLDIINFKLKVSPPKAGDNIVVQMKAADRRTGSFSDYPVGMIITDKVPGMDTIMEFDYGMRSDSLLKYLEKAPNASWSIEWKGGTTRTDIQSGDVLKVTAENGSVKRYYLKPNAYIKSHNRSLASITWPDIPEFYKGIFGWVGDTIPAFNPNKFAYKVMVPADVDGIPALVAKPQVISAKVAVDKVKTMRGTPEDRTVTYTVTAEDDTSVNSYAVILEKQKEYQPWQGEPFVSEYVFWDQWSNGFLEICNPGTIPLDLSNYMIFFQWAGDPGNAITWFGNPTEGDFVNRYAKYIPGYRWQDRDQWFIQPGIAMQDLLVNPIVEPGDVFVIGDIRTTANSGYPWFASNACDIEFQHNPWGDTARINETVARQWVQSGSATLYLYKILNDSIKQGLKPALDPADFQLIETMGNDKNETWVVGGKTAEQPCSWERKPEYYKPNPLPNSSFGTDEASSEWILHDRPFFAALNVGWPAELVNIADRLGVHEMKEVTEFNSTVGSMSYVVSDGYSMDETIKGISAGITVDEFLANLNQADPAQTLVVFRPPSKGGLNDTLVGSDVLEHGDILAVTSANKDNETDYMLDLLTALSSNAVLSSAAFDVTVGGSTGTIGGFSYGTALRDVFNGVEVPAGASMVIVDGTGAYVPFLKLAFNDTSYNEVYASSDVYFEVTAEDGTTKITYQLTPDQMLDGAFVTSTVFLVDQAASNIDLVPRDITVFGLLSNLIPAENATMKVLDKLGFERVIGYVAFDDQIQVTSADGMHTKTYSLQVLPLKSNKFAFVYSDVYTILQPTRKISGGIEDWNTTVEEFLANLILSPGASMKVMNKKVEVTTGLMKKGYTLVVTAEDGITWRLYSITVAVGIQDKAVAVLRAYPNPSDGTFTLTGLQTGSRIQVTNMLGQLIMDRAVMQNAEEISLTGQRSGVYLVTVRKGNAIAGHCKLILK